MIVKSGVCHPTPILHSLQEVSWTMKLLLMIKISKWQNQLHINELLILTVTVKYLFPKNLLDSNFKKNADEKP